MWRGLRRRAESERSVADSAADEEVAGGRADARPFNPRDSAVLIVEDSPDDALVVARALENFGVRQVLHAETGEEALHILSRQACDAALIDYNLPGINGLRLLERLRETQPDLRVIVVTGVRDEQVAVSAMKLGAADYVTKDDLLTSGIVRSLQRALRNATAEDAERRREGVGRGAGTFDAAAEEATWLLGSLAPEGLRAQRWGRRAGDPEVGSAPVDDALEAFETYLRASCRSFPEVAREEEDGLVRMLTARGLSPREVLMLYRACLAELALERRDPPLHPALPLVRVLARLVEQYQARRSLEAMEARSA